jgi:vacuolar-type H+-ATPase subunit I/STV1
MSDHEALERGIQEEVQPKLDFLEGWCDGMISMIDEEIDEVEEEVAELEQRKDELEQRKANLEIMNSNINSAARMARRLV